MYITGVYLSIALCSYHSNNHIQFHKALSTELWSQSRSFAMRLSKSAVYNPHKCDMSASDLADDTSEPPCTTVIDRNIVITDHFFDTSDRRRCKPRQAKPSDVVINGTMTGERGVRENYKVVTSRILPI